jgi:isoleucyl-tRNA synthetase
MSAERFRRLAPDRPADELERELLERWREESLFERTLEAHKNESPFVFFEGPPTANGRPGIHHVFSRTIKDLFCRHRAMHGRFVLRKAGWDTHGLPVEIEVEKELQRRWMLQTGAHEVDSAHRGKQLIEETGVEEFNRMCRESVFRYRGDWEKLSERIAYWLDYGDPYVTYTNEYVESVWWALKTLYENGRLYRGHKILPYCARCGTALSSHEVAQGYEDVEDPSVYVALELRSEARGPKSEENTRRRLLVWTTTPWTLVSNVALAVHPELTYVELRKRRGADWTIILAEARAGAVLGEDYTDRWETVAAMTGADLAGQRYERPLDWAPITSGAHEIIVAEDFVSADDGSGIVHMAPAFGADDYAAGQRHGLAFVQPVNARGEFDETIPVVGGKFVKDADALIVEELEKRDRLWKAGKLLHAYPHCWRCGTPLLYYARASWFVRTSSYKDEMLARNARVEWHPQEIGERRFGEWLANNIDWAISRDRYWGSPLPIWVCENDRQHVVAIGSYAELAEKLGAPLPDDFDPHKPFVDRLEFPCAECATRPSPRGPRFSMMRREPEVIDTWFDSGSMSFAQWHYPFENQERLRAQYPADFICEGIDQTRGWFYSLLAIATGLGDALPNNASGSYDTAPYRAVVVNDLVLDATGVKMSKSRGNVVDPWEVIQRHGVDAIRIFLVASSQLDMPRRFDENAIRETASRFLLTLKNVYSGSFAQYANFGWAPSDRDPTPAARREIDRWILSRLTTVEREVDELMTRYDATAAVRHVMQFVVEDVSNWYVRLNRGRFYDVESEDDRAAFATLHEVLTVACRLLAPFAPFLSDWIHRELTGSSVHLAPYVRSRTTDVDPALERAMDEVRELSRLGRAAREEAGINVRRPLSRLVCVVPDTNMTRVRSLLPLLASELNVKEATLLTSADDLVRLEAKANFRALGKKFGKATPLAARAVEALTSEHLRAFERGEPLAISVENESRVLDAEDITIVRRASGALVVKEHAGRFAAIDPTVTPELRREGLARELVSRIQRMRKDAGLAVSDRIRLFIAGTDEIELAVQEYKDWIAGEVLAREVVIGPDGTNGKRVAQSVEVDGLTARVALTTDD